MSVDMPREVDTVIVGSGPSALILSYILHGNVPFYNGIHHDPIVHNKLCKSPDLLRITPDAYEHFHSSLRYSTDALPINTLLDTLIRPNADTEIDPRPCLEWRYQPEKAVSHLVLGNTSRPGGQWAEPAVATGWDIGTLGYAEMLSLPGYTLADHYLARNASPLPVFTRPNRREMADYLATYPEQVGIRDSIVNGVGAGDISRTQDGFYVASHNVRCKHLVLASGIFSVNKPPPTSLQPLTPLCRPDKPLLVVGSGFTAADVILGTRPTRDIIHVYRWAPDTRPSPLKGCHHQAYPEYAGIYRQMRIASKRRIRYDIPSNSTAKRKSSDTKSSRDWAATYQGFANAAFVRVRRESDYATVTLRLPSGEEVTLEVGGLEYVVGRRGSLDFLDERLQTEVLGTNHTRHDDGKIGGQCLRAKALNDLEVAPSVCIIGSLTGDSLVRFAFGSCVYAAGRIMRPQWLGQDRRKSSFEESSCGSCCTESTPRSGTSTPPSCVDWDESEVVPAGSGHQDLHIDRRKLARTSA